MSTKASGSAVSAKTSVVPLTEAEMLAGLRSAAKSLGYLTYHSQYSIGSERGYPDLIVVGHGKQFVFELKGPRGKWTPEQQDWLVAYGNAGVVARFIYPIDYDWALQQLMEGAS